MPSLPGARQSATLGTRDLVRHFSIPTPERAARAIGTGCGFMEAAAVAHSYPLPYLGAWVRLTGSKVRTCG
jgi:hypothetical protein